MNPTHYFPPQPLHYTSNSTIATATLANTDGVEQEVVQPFQEEPLPAPVYAQLETVDFGNTVEENSTSPLLSGDIASEKNTEPAHSEHFLQMQRINRYLLFKMQREFFNVQQQLSIMDKKRIFAFQQQCLTSLSFGHIDVKIRCKNGSLVTPDWMKLELAFARIGGKSLNGSEFFLGPHFAKQAIFWLTHALREGYRVDLKKTRNIISAHAFTVLCTEAILSQEITIAKTIDPKYYLTNEPFCLVESVVVPLFLYHMEYFNQEFAVALVRKTRLTKNN